MKTIILEKGELFRTVKEQISEILNKKPDAVIAMSAGRTMQLLWKILSDLDLSQARLFLTADFIGADAKKSLRSMMEAELIKVSSLRAENCSWITEENVQDYDAEIASAGGIDLAILGLGDNAHIGFNEPATQFDTRSHRQKLTEKTRKQYAWRFENEESVPTWGVTMGIRTLTEAKRIMVIATGDEKAQAVFDMLYARDDSVIPAAFLQIPPEVNVYVDPEAGQKL